MIPRTAVTRGQVRPAQWHRPEDALPGRTTPPGAPPVLAALTRAVEDGQDTHAQLRIERQRLSGRSTIYVVRGRTPAHGDVHWVVKQPHAQWTQDDLGSPLTALEEFSTLQRLREYFSRSGLPFRVPAPVAFLPEVDALVMEHVGGRSLRDMLTYRSLVRPRPLLEGITAAGTFLRHLHAREAPPPTEVDLRGEAEEVLAVAAEKLHPLGLDLPAPVRRTLAEFPAVRVTAPRVWLHGDFGPSNMLVQPGGDLAAIDVSSCTTGYPEDDLARFVAVVAGSPRLAAEGVAPGMGAVRRHLESCLLRAYYQQETPPLLFGIRYLHQLCRRWCRLRELGEQRQRRVLPGTRTRTRTMIVDRQLRLLMLDGQRRLVRGLEE